MNEVRDHPREKYNGKNCDTNGGCINVLNSCLTLASFLLFALHA